MCASENLSDFFDSLIQPNSLVRKSSVIALTARVASLASNSQVRRKLQERKQTISTVTWEDTSRNKNSCWGSNISDQTLVVKKNGSEYCMPVIRKPNYTDETVDVPIENLSVLIGNEVKKANVVASEEGAGPAAVNGNGGGGGADNGTDLTPTPLKTYLESMGWYVPERDKHIMVSTQTCVLPLEEGFCKFGVKLYNYQTKENDPALAVIVSSPQGTSTAAITKRNQTLYFNNHGKAHEFEARRLEEDRKERNVTNLAKLDLTQEEKQGSVLFVFHIPLKQKPVIYRSSNMIDECAFGSAGGFFGGGGGGGGGGGWGSKSKGGPVPMAKSMPVKNTSANCIGSANVNCASANDHLLRGGSAGFDAAILRVNETSVGDFDAITPETSSKYVRDVDSPIRLVIQNYTGTDVSDLTDEALDYIVSRLNAPLPVAVASGSHVTETNDHRLTAAAANKTSAPAAAVAMEVEGNEVNALPEPIPGYMLNPNMI